jgi:sugar phosphate isomerase/epimerase
VSRTLAVSSFSLWENLGGLRIPVTTDTGERTEIVLPRTAELTIEEFPLAARERLGVNAVEICQIQLASSAITQLTALRGKLDEAGVRLLNMPIDAGDVTEPNDARREADLVTIEGWIEAAQFLGAQFCRVRATFEPTNANLERGVASFVRLADFAESRGIRLLIENQGGVSGSVDELLALLDAVGPEHLGLLLDTGNFEPLMSVSNAKTSGHPLPERPLDLEPLFGAIEALASRAELVHAKSHEFTPSGEHTPFDLRRGLQIIAESGYAGPVSVEYEGMTGDRWINTARTLETVQAVFA